MPTNKQIQQITQRLDQLAAEIKVLREAYGRSLQTITRQENEIRQKDQHNAQLLQLIDELTLEKRSIESELENLRGY